MARGRKSTPQDFWDRVNIGTPDECWPWQGSCDPGGYGQLGYQGRAWKAHRLAYALSHDDGSRMTPDEIKEAFMDELAQGHEVLRVGPCDNFDPKTGCKGHPVTP